MTISLFDVSKMRSFLFLTLLAVTAAANYDEVLKSPRLSVQEFRSFAVQHDRHYTAGESALRYKIFRRSMEFVNSENNQELGWESELNFFADLTTEERGQWLGLNVSLAPTSSLASSLALSDDPLPDTVNWISGGRVTPVKNQGSCGSCWSFGATVALEGVYTAVGGKLKNFAEQELLDCVYEKRSGCRGGWHTTCYDYSRRNNRLAITANYPYTATDSERGRCDLSSIPDGLQSAKVTGYTGVDKGEDFHLQALAITPTAVAFEVTNSLHMYKSGIMKDRTCRGSVNHAVAAVGYSPTYIVVKNSWGKVWGDSGFVKMARNHHNCKLHDYVAYPTLQATSDPDTDPESVQCDYDPEANPGPTPGPDPKPDPDCHDEFENWCRPEPAWCNNPVYFEKLCRKTCGNCVEDPTKKPDVCPSGTVRCPDGICKHEHMC